MATSIPFYPKNDLAILVHLKDVDPVTGKVTNLTTGTVTAFIAISNLPTATAADPSLSVSATYTGAGGKWLVSFDASLFDPTLLNTLFATASAYLIVEQTGGIRTYIPLAYTPSRLGTIS